MAHKRLVEKRLKTGKQLQKERDSREVMEPKSFMVRGYFREPCAATSPPGSYSGVTYERPRDGPSKWTLLLCCEISVLKQSATLHLCRLAQHEGERPE